MTDDGKNGPSGTLVAADMAFVDGEVHAGIALYRETVGLDPSRRVPLLMRLAVQLLGRRLPSEALAVMD